MNKQAPELSPEARRLISEARGADDPTADDHARVKARWLASVAAIAGVSSLTEAARAAGGIGWGLKAAGAALVIAAGAIGLNFLLDTGDATQAQKTAPPPGWSGSAPERFQKTPRPRTGLEHAPPAAARPGEAPAEVSGAQHALPPAEAAELAQPQVTEGSVPPAAPSEAIAPVPGAPATLDPEQPSAAQANARPQSAVAPAEAAASPQVAVRARPATRTAAARVAKAADKEKEAAVAPAPVESTPTVAGPNGQLSEELALLSDVRSSIQEGAAARAIELLNRYEARFGQPILGMEADALRVDALCKAGQRDAARERARAFQNEWPGSPLERRVSDACP